MNKNLKTLLSIAGSDPVGGAGIQADIRTGVSLGFHVMTAVTAVTVQNSHGLKEIGNIPAQQLKSQLEAIREDVIPDGIKIGMVGSHENFDIIAEFLKSIPSEIPVVIDPVMTASADHHILVGNSSEKKLSRLYIDKIFPYASLVTPNYKELLYLLDSKKLDNFNLKGIQEKLHVKSMIITNGDEEELTDILLYSGKTFSYVHDKIECKNLHGTGCVYSTLMACYLALGYDMVEAFKAANFKMEEIIYNSIDYNLGSSNYGPLNINNYKK